MAWMAKVTLRTLSLSLAACSEPPTLLGDACTSEVVVTVTEAAPPVVQWAPECEVGTLYVTTDAGTPVWQIHSVPEADLTPTNHIQPGVVYGVLPPQTQVFIGPTDLVADQAYHLSLIVTNSQGDDTTVGMGTFTFRAP
jgi:hypothetical protein